MSKADTNQASDVYATMPEFYNCEVCGRELPTTARCNPQAHIGLATSTTNTLDTNQASEDELRDELYDLAFLTGADSETGERTLAFIASELAEYVQALIRTEKLKLLAEVRERVVGEDEEQPDFQRLPQVYDTVDLLLERNKLRDDQRVKLSKLEAEL